MITLEWVGPDGQRRWHIDHDVHPGDGDLGTPVPAGATAVIVWVGNVDD